jgi:hypothetical protein
MRPDNESPIVDNNMMMPRVTWTPWKPVSVKNAEQDGLVGVAEPSRSRTRELVDLTGDEQRAQPRGGSQPCPHGAVLAPLAADTASTMVSELISSTNDDIEVNANVVQVDGERSCRAPSPTRFL